MKSVLMFANQCEEIVSNWDNNAHCLKHAVCNYAIMNFSYAIRVTVMQCPFPYINSPEYP